MNKNDLIDIEEKCEKTLKEFGYMMPWFYLIDNTRKLELGIPSCIKVSVTTDFDFILSWRQHSLFVCNRRHTFYSITAGTRQACQE